MTRKEINGRDKLKYRAWSPHLKAITLNKIQDISSDMLR